MEWAELFKGTSGGGVGTVSSVLPVSTHALKAAATIRKCTPTKHAGVPVVFSHKEHCMFPDFLVPHTFNSRSLQGLRNLEMTNGKRKLLSACARGCSRPLGSVLGSQGSPSCAAAGDMRPISKTAPNFSHSQCQPWPDAGLWAVALQRPFSYVPRGCDTGFMTSSAFVTP